MNFKLDYRIYREEKALGVGSVPEGGASFKSGRVSMLSTVGVDDGAAVEAESKYS